MKRIFSTILALLLAGSFAVVASADDAELENYCLGAAVTVSGTETAELVGELAVDGDMATRWASDYVDDASIIIDLGTIRPIGYISIEWEAAFASDYTIETASSADSWEHTVVTETGNTEQSKEYEFTPVTGRYIKLQVSKRATEWGNSIYEFVARKSKDQVKASELPANYPSSGTEIPNGSVLINGERIGLEEGWGGNAAAGRDAAFDGDVNTFFDPLGTGDGWAGIDAGEEMILTKIMICPRDGQLPRFNGGTIEGANEEDFSDAEAIFFSIEEATEFGWIDCSDEIDSDVNNGYRYFRYINYTTHGDVADVELYGYAKDGTNPTYGAAEAPVVEEPVVEAPVVEEPVVEAPVEEAPVEEEVVVEAPVEEVVEAPAAEAAPAPETFDMGIIAAVAGIVSLAGYAVSKKH